VPRHRPARSTSGDGRLHYGDKPKDVQAESVIVEPSSGSGETPPSLASEKDRMAECAKQKALLEGYKKAPGITEVDALGRKRDYTSAEREQFLALKEQKLAELCVPPKVAPRVDSFPPPEAPDPAINLPPEEPAG
jgi:hypothetical protein